MFPDENKAKKVEECLYIKICGMIKILALGNFCNACLLFRRRISYMLKSNIVVSLICGILRKTSH